MIELELLDFKKEIEEKFKASKVNSEYVFPLKSSDRGAKFCESLESFDDTKEFYLRTEGQQPYDASELYMTTDEAQDPSPLARKCKRKRSPKKFISNTKTHTSLKLYKKKSKKIYLSMGKAFSPRHKEKKQCKSSRSG